MKKSTLWGAAFLGIFIFSMTMFSQAMSNTTESAMAINPIAGNYAQNVATGQNIATSNNLPADPVERSATAMTAAKSNMLANLLRVGKESRPGSRGKLSTSTRYENSVLAGWKRSVSFPRPAAPIRATRCNPPTLSIPASK